jgi:hypothetical protein
VSRNIPALIAMLEDWQARPFRWRRGRDCVSFAAAAIEAQTGRDPLADIALWSTRAEALALAEAEGGLKAALDKRLMQLPPALAQRGDIAGVLARGSDRRFGIRLAVIEGATLVGPGACGLERLPRAVMVMAWSALPIDQNGEPADG